MACSIDVIGDFREELGESPVWCEENSLLYWIDIRRKLIRCFELSSGTFRSWSLLETVGSIVLRRQGGLLIALQSRLALFNPVDGSIQSTAAPTQDEPHLRFNDGKCDPAGRFIVGTMDDASRGPIGTLWLFEGSGQRRALVEGCRIPNGLAWSPEGDRMFFADTKLGKIDAYSYDVATGTIGPSIPFAAVSQGGPDGATVDSQGYYWSAIYGGWRLERYAPDGTLDRVVTLPVENPTSCCFGGNSYETLYVTSAWQRLSHQELEAQPLAGALLSLDVGVAGLPGARFAG